MTVGWLYLEEHLDVFLGDGLDVTAESIGGTCRVSVMTAKCRYRASHTIDET